MRLVLTTIDSLDGAEALARAIVESRLAACVNVVAGLTSIYWWEHDVQKTAEWLLLIKTTKEHLEALGRFLEENHPYDLPEFVVVNPEQASSDYEEWVRSSTRSPDAES